MSSISKHNKPNTRGGPTTRSGWNSIKNHDDKLAKLQAEYEKLKETRNLGMSTEEDEARISAIEKEMKKYADAMTQMNLNTTIEPGSESSAAVEQHANEPDTNKPNTTEPNATEPNATEPNVAEPNVTVNPLDTRRTYANAQESPSKHGERKKEFVEDSKPSTNRLVDNLNMAWDVNDNDTHGESLLQNYPKEAFGHIMRNSRTRYCVRYGSADARSARFESILPDGSKYDETRDVTKGSNRIVERIVQLHRDSKTALPMNILSKVKILSVYWDSKVGLGHKAEVDVLAPDFPGRRPHTRCYIYLAPKLYQQYGLVNTSGFSHETRSTMKLLMEGNDDWQKSIALHNIAVRLENKFEEKWMSGVPDRPGPLPELVDERKVVSRRTRSPYATVEPLASPMLMKPAISPHHSPHHSLRQPTPPPETRHEQASTGAKPGMSLKQRFHMDFLELFDLAENVTYADLTEQQQLLYPAQFTKWKAVNA